MVGVKLLRLRVWSDGGYQLATGFPFRLDRMSAAINRKMIRQCWGFVSFSRQSPLELRFSLQNGEACRINGPISTTFEPV